MKKIAILFVVFFCSVSLWAQTIEDDATWKLKTDTVRALKHYKAGDNWFIGIQPRQSFAVREQPLRIFRRHDQTEHSPLGR